MTFIDAPDGRGGFMAVEQDKMAELFGVGNQAIGAIPNGRRIRKVNSEEDDRTPDGALGTILSSVGGVGPVFIDGRVINFMYAIKWDDEPEGNTVAISDGKIEEVE